MTEPSAGCTGLPLSARGFASIIWSIRRRASSTIMAFSLWNIIRVSVTEMTGVMIM